MRWGLGQAKKYPHSGLGNNTIAQIGALWRPAPSSGAVLAEMLSYALRTWERETEAVADGLPGQTGRQTKERLVVPQEGLEQIRNTQKVLLPHGNL